MRSLVSVTACAVVLSCTPAVRVGSPTPATAPGANPFFRASSLPYQAPPFDKIHDSDYRTAIVEGMRQQLAEIQAIANDPAPPTFDNTITAMERSGALLTRASKVFGAVTGANTNDTLDAIQSELAPKLASHSDEIFLDSRLFQRVKSIYDRRAQLRLDAEQARLIDRYYTRFVRAGALLSDPDKAKLRALNQEESKLSTDFQLKLTAATKAGALVISDSTELAGLSPGDVAAAADAAKERKLPGKWVLPLQNTTQQPSQASLRNRGV